MRRRCQLRRVLFRWFAWSALSLIALACEAQPLANAVSQPSDAVYDLDRDRLPVVSMDGTWRFQPGDDPGGTRGWASPTFDDTSWRLVHAGKGWLEEPAAAFAGSAWFRARISIPPGTTDLAAYVPALFLNYQLYADGQLLGGIGAMPPDSRPATMYPQVFAIPHSPAARSVVLALRVWRWPQWNYFYKFALPVGIQVGSASLLQEKRVSGAKETSWDEVSNMILLIAELLFGIAALGLFSLRRSEYVNLWFGIMLVFSAAGRAWGIWPQSHSVSISTYYVVLQGLSAIWRLAQIFFFYSFLKGKLGWLFWFAVVTTVLVAVGAYPLFFPAYFPTRVGAVPIIAWTGLISTFQAAPAIWVLTLLFRRAREGREDARLLLVPVILKQMTPILFFIGYWGNYGFGWRPAILARLDEIATSPFSFSYNDLASGLFLVAMLAILIRRFVQTAAQEEEHHRERDAARAVQHVLVPEEHPVVPGFKVQSIYLPFGEVGGDFFQIVPRDDSSVLVAVGDVSGKGLPAAMTVALLVGTFRTLAMYSREPGEILSSMNRALAGRGNGGFTTCLVLRADPDGTLTIANAGHIPPYLNGEELEQECELPLGILDQTTYTQQSHHFEFDGQLTLLTDGVIEARSDNGELFGFERTAAVSRASAKEIAQAAKDFGQDDDITVLNLIRLA